MSAFDVDGLNAGYARALLDEYLENPEAVPSEWRRLFESGDSELVATHPGLLKLLETLRTDGNGASAVETAAPAAPAGPGRARRRPAARRRRRRDGTGEGAPNARPLGR